MYRRARQSDFSSLQEYATRIVNAVATGDDRLIGQTEVDFHEEICRLSGISRLHAIFLQHVGLWRALLIVDEHLCPVVADTSDEHYGIVRAMRFGDEAAVTKMLESHLERSKERLVGFLESRPVAATELAAGAG